MEGDYFYIENADEFALAFEDSEQVYNWLVDLHKEIEIQDLTEVLQLFLDMEMNEHYLAVKRFIAHYLE